MIFIYWHVFILLEAIVHYFVIEVIQFDLTPDKHLLSISKTLVVGLRLMLFLLFWWTLGIHSQIEFWCYFAGALFSHLLWFPLVLNKLRGKRLGYLGKGPVDRILRILEPQACWWFLLVLEAAAIYTYYNTDLLA